MCQRDDDKKIQKILDEIAEKIEGEAGRQVREKIARAAVEGEPIIALTKDALCQVSGRFKNGPHSMQIRH